MAEIKIEKKKPVWPWILAAVIVIGLVLLFLIFRDNLLNVGDENDTTQTEQTGNTNTTEVAAVTAYVDFVNSNRTMSLDHAYTNNALNKLTDAVQAKAEQVNYDVKADLDKVREHADRITHDPFETTHANSIRSAADILAQAMQNMQQAKFPDLSNESDRVKQAAAAIDPNVLTLDQRDAVKAFFQESAQLLQRMN